MRRDIYFEPIGFELLPDTFSMAELQKIIETITGEKYDRRNFYNKMRHTKMVMEVDAKISEDRQYSFEITDKFSSFVSTNENKEKINSKRPSLQKDDEFLLEEPYYAMMGSLPCEAIEEKENIRKSKLNSKPRRSNVRYSFNALGFLKRKKDKGETPFSF